MAMRQVYGYSQSKDRFEREPAGVCQALSAQWIVARAKWQARGARGEWTDASWMGAKNDMSAHVDRIYGATRAARASVVRQEKDLMQQETERFNREKVTLIKQQNRRATTMTELLATDGAPPPEIPGHTADDLERRLGGIYIPTLPRMLEALMNDIASQGGLTGGSVHSFSDVQATAAPIQVLSLRAGYNLIDLRDRSLAREGGAHAIAAEIRMDETRLFDPTYGEWMSVPPESAFTSFGVQLGSLVREYGLDSVATLSVIHFKLS
jgi:Yersinia/Haemophilus virulence surface antigen